MDSIEQVPEPLEIRHIEVVNDDASPDIEISNIEDVANIQETMKDRSKRRLVDKIKFSTLYIRKYWDGRLKIVQFFSTLLAVAILPTDYQYYHTRFIFFRFVFATAFIFVTIDLFLHLLSLWERLPICITTPNVLMLFTILAAMATAACSSLVIGIAKFSGSNESHALAACIAGFASMLFFGIESFLHLLRYRTSMPLVAYRVE